MIRHHDVIIDVRIRKMTGDCQPTFLRNHSGCIQLHFLVQDLAEATGVIPRADCDEIVSLPRIITFLKSVFLSGFHFSKIIPYCEPVRRRYCLHHIETWNRTHVCDRSRTVPRACAASAPVPTKNPNPHSSIGLNQFPHGRDVNTRVGRTYMSDIHAALIIMSKRRVAYMRPLHRRGDLTIGSDIYAWDNPEEELSPTHHTPRAPPGSPRSSRASPRRAARCRPRR